MFQTVFSITLGLALAANCGLRAFMPLFVLGLLSKLFGDSIPIQLAESFQWLGETPALIALGVAVVAEIAGDKVPALDNVLDMIQTPVRTGAGILVMAAVMADLPTWITALTAIVIGGGAALSVHATKAAVRATSTATTAGIANPFISLIEDFVCLLGSVLAVVFTVVAAILALMVLGFVGFALRLLWKRRKSKRAAAADPPPAEPPPAEPPPAEPPPAE